MDLPQYISSGQLPQVSHKSSCQLPQLGKSIIVQFKLHLVYQLPLSLLPSSHSSQSSLSIIPSPHVGFHSLFTLQNAPAHIPITVEGIITLVTFVHEKASSHIYAIYCPSSNGASLKSTVHLSASHL
ncbi:hypothetical protein IKO50_00755 [bacterium]|jgi:hypothetical protein|nr:hypothetical protein [bacterium]